MPSVAKEKGRWTDSRKRCACTRARLTRWPAKPRQHGLASGLLYAGAEGLDTLKAHMRTLYRERKEGTGEGYGHEFFRGMLHGLALADAMDAQVSVGIHDFIKVWGYITD